MINIKVKRIMAYMIDLMIVITLIGLISQIKCLNPNEDKYNATYDEYSEYMSSMDSQNLTVEDVINEEYISYVYDISYYSISYTITQIVVIVLYFTLFPLFNKNKTIGKSLMKIEVKKSDNRKAGFLTHFVRSLLVPIWSSIVLYNVVTFIFSVAILFIFKDYAYLYSSLIITYGITIYCYVDIIFMLVRKDGRSLHDLICNTTVEEL